MMNIGIQPFLLYERSFSSKYRSHSNTGRLFAGSSIWLNILRSCIRLQIPLKIVKSFKTSHALKNGPKVDSFSISSFCPWVKAAHLPSHLQFSCVECALVEKVSFVFVMVIMFAFKVCLEIRAFCCFDNHVEKMWLLVLTVHRHRLTHTYEVFRNHDFNRRCTLDNCLVFAWRKAIFHGKEILYVSWFFPFNLFKYHLKIGNPWVNTEPHV